MNRRTILKSAGVALAAGMGSTAPATLQASEATGQSHVDGPYVRSASGQSLFYRDWGTGDPIVFLAAWAMPSDMWAYQMAPLSERFRTVAYDRRGHGRSSDSGSGFDYDTLADDLASVLEALDLRSVTLVGMSMAGGEMVRYLSRHGSSRIARLVFVGTAATPFILRTADNPGGIPAERFEQFRTHALLTDYPRWLEENRPAFFAADTSREMQEWVRSMMLTCSMKALIECNRSGTSTDFRAELRLIRLPSLVIHGDRDVSAPLALTGKPTAALIPGARLTVYEGAPHGLFVTHRQQLIEDIGGFAQGQPR